MKHRVWAAVGIILSLLFLVVLFIPEDVPIDRNDRPSRISPKTLSAASVSEQIADYVPENSLKTVLSENRYPITVTLLLLLLSLAAVYSFAEHADKKQLEKNYRAYRDVAERLIFQTERARILDETSEEAILEYLPATDTMTFILKDEQAETQRTTISSFLSGSGWSGIIRQDSQEIFRSLLRECCLLPETHSFECSIRLTALSSDFQWYKVVLHSVAGKSGQAIVVFGRLENIHTLVMERNAALKKATTDSLLGIDNRASLIQKAEKLLEADCGAGLAVVMLDVDNFKTVNDTLGHIEGDELLKQMAQLLQTLYAPRGAVGRYGGDEFIAVLTNVSAEEVRSLAERFRVSAAAISTRGIHVACSQGIVFTSSPGRNLSALIYQADSAMYQAKLSGKNCVVLADDLGTALCTECGDR